MRRMPPSTRLGTDLGPRTASPPSPLGPSPLPRPSPPSASATTIFVIFRRV